MTSFALFFLSTHNLLKSQKIKSKRVMFNAHFDILNGKLKFHLLSVEI